MTAPGEKGRNTEVAWEAPFLARLAETGNITRSAKRAGISRMTVYRRRQESEVFRQAYDEALRVAVMALEDEARRRAYEGTLEPVFYQGARAGHIRRYSDTLLIFLLKAHKPEVYRETIGLRHDGRIEHEHSIAAEQLDRSLATLADAIRDLVS